ncbi:NahK/ErcS family hybrid sensor histidine kinase/response regulator [Aeromonas hydrophila]|uniref:hybrid sensor histidine kinase/response regulator n=1 Tax=Aeromonas TaxID=642 RepID=UPI000465C4D5|nr:MULTISPECIES: PAS domain-containing hybrid sensor histidine kinase/response regulator [Aeromonas]MBL0573615.1 PAS-domain containing protein [Aeromonas hydrophila]WGY31400.1 PAS domain-containing hybrid sensor histidine kinase/response regulator [Aeromonas hydrophila]BDC83686.1 hybrid sensor histidine kinase/response regulator [Aeromonas hydrophila]HAT2490148.1 response regulator [Aeromonas hydrophila]HAT2494878.1 response regulator [Aeromonas hydrophila]
MHQGWLLIGLSLSYLGLLFLIAYVADKNKRRRLKGQPLLYSLSLAVYCTSWTFFGTVGQASESPWSPVPIYLGPMLVFLFGWRLLARLILVAKREHITSIADFIAARYGKSQRLAMVIALIAIMGILPYLVLQLKAIVTGLDLLMANSVPAGPTGNTAGLALGVALLLALFSILFGTRHLDATEHHRGMVVAIAFESVVKLLAFMAVGGFALWLILSKPSQARTLVASDFLDAVVAVTPGSLLELAIYTLVAMCAVICLPRQFHVTVVENNQGQDLHWARWLFPLYLFVMGLFIWPLALAGKQWVGAGMASDTYVISLPMSLGFDGMALLAFLGGTSAATGMVIVCTIALAIMVSNDLVLPVLLRRFWQQGRDERLVRLLLQVRRGAILLILLAAWGLYLWLGDLTSLSRIGYLSFGAVAQFAPALLLGLYWRHGNRKGVYLGLALGVSLWFATLLAESGLLAGSPLAALLAPPDWPAFRDLSLGAWCIFLSLLLNLVGYVAGSLLSQAAVSERLQAANFVGKPSRDTTALYQARVSVKELEMLAARFVGSSRVKRAFGRFAGERGGTLAPQMQASAELIAHTERLLAGVFGTSSARLVLASALQGRNMQLEEIATIVDEASDVFRFNRGLLQGAIEHMGQGISVVDRELKLVAWNRRYIELFHYPPGLIQVGRPIEEIIRYNAEQGLCGPGDVEAHVARRVAFMQRGSQHISARERPDGRVIEMQGNPMPAGGFVMTFTDITPFRDAERVLREANEHLEARVAERTHELSELNRQLLLVNQQVERANHSKSRFLAAVSHDLTQPLNAAKLFTSSLLEMLPPADEPARIARHIDDALGATEDLITDLLDISRLEAGKFKAKKLDFALRDVFDNLKAEFGVLAQAGGIQFSVVESGVAVYSDVRLLRRVLQNFLTNAFRYNPGGRVLLGCRRLGDKVRIEVWDNGPGIPADKQEAIFDEFSRLDHSRTAREQGLGLGLAIARGIALVLGHNLTLRSWPGAGSVFAITLNLATRPVATTQVAAPTQRDSQLEGIRVLCIDNESDILIAMHSLLGRWGCEVVCAQSLAQAEDLIAGGFLPQLVLSDYHLDDGKTGLQALHMLRLAHGNDIGGIIISADRKSELQAQIREHGYGYISKPVKPLKLRALMNSILRPAKLDDDHETGNSSEF